MLDYKRIFKSRKNRENILRLLSFIPDKAMIQLQYRIKTGRKLNLTTPTRYSEKMQWCKLYYRNPLMVCCTDKYDVREYVQKKGYGHLLNECYGVFEDASDIDFSKFPKQFVLKDTLGSAAVQVMIIKNKDSADIEAVRNRANEWTRIPHNIRDGGREWAYNCGKPHRIIAEKFIASDVQKGGLIDYKFFCFNGKAKYLLVICDRDMGQAAGLGIFDINFNKLPYRRLDENPLTRQIDKPKNFEKMVKISEDLSKDFPYVRVDLYNQDGNIIFGELSFFDGSGYMRFEPDDFDLILGKEFILPPRNN